MKKIMIFLLMSIFLVSACTQQSRQNPQDLVGQGTPVPQQANTNEVSQQTIQATPSNAAANATASSAAPQKTPITAPAAPGSSPVQNSTASVKEFRITAKQFSFEPSTIEVNKGDKVRLIVTSVDVPHGIAITEYGINRRLDPGVPATIEFTADKQGTFTAFCSVFCGSGHSGMKGKLIVH